MGGSCLGICPASFALGPLLGLLGASFGQGPFRGPFWGSPSGTLRSLGWPLVGTGPFLALAGQGDVELLSLSCFYSAPGVAERILGKAHEKGYEYKPKIRNCHKPKEPHRYRPKDPHQQQSKVEHQDLSLKKKAFPNGCRPRHRATARSTPPNAARRTLRERSWKLFPVSRAIQNYRAKTPTCFKCSGKQGRVGLTQSIREAAPMKNLEP